MSWIFFITLAVCCFISMWIGYGIGFIAGFYKGLDEGKKWGGRMTDLEKLNAVAVKILLWHLHHPDANPELLDELRDAAGLSNEELLEMDTCKTTSN